MRTQGGDLWCNFLLSCSVPRRFSAGGCAHCAHHPQILGLLLVPPRRAVRAGLPQVRVLAVLRLQCCVPSPHQGQADDVTLPHTAWHRVSGSNADTTSLLGPTFPSGLGRGIKKYRPHPAPKL